jgi:hypothetical protein
LYLFGLFYPYRYCLRHIGLVFAIQIRKAGELEGFKPNGMATAGLVLNIIGLGLCALAFIACVACVGIIGTAGLYS